MSRVSTYLNFPGTTEEAFAFYASVFGTEPSVPLQRFGEVPAGPGAPELPDHERSKVLHVELPILAGHVIMATDMLESMGHELRVGNNTTLNLEPDTRDKAERLYAALSEGGADGTGLNHMPWGSYWGTCLDRFGVRWMFNVTDAVQ
ncbi:MAG TPA: VOC family protein [Acidimicrobiales bacterium]